MIRCWPKSLEEKWAWASRCRPEEIVGYEDRPEECFYLSEKELEFLWRAKHSKEFLWMACRFCKKEWMWSNVSLRVHLGSCEEYQQHCAIWRIEHLGRRVIVRSLRKGIYKLEAEDIFHRNEIVEFSGGPEENEGEIIHYLIEEWKTECAPLCAAWVRRVDNGSRKLSSYTNPLGGR